MIVSHHYKYIFIHVHKAAGTSMRAALRDPLLKPSMAGVWPSDDQSLFKNEIFSHGLDVHTNASDLKQYLEKHSYNWEDYTKFAFIRNPFDRMVSLYFFYVEKIHEKLISKKMREYCTHVKSMGIEKFLEEKQVPTQHEMLHDKDGKCLIDFVGRFENVDQDFDKISKQIFGQKIILGQHNATSKKHYSEYYNEHTKQNVIDNYSKDFILGGYGYEL